ncbi:GTP cyclohydrolase I [Solibacillus silvestris StLB046]|uniref:GTP cyclohydrolase I n=1 Tax=Solibacillus silvestris (strain StLB046) TaxID=1002809 RepID=F2FAS9_SOLSS|nr:GTP cyclohydrolase I [Solibacillus silvestris StLB046]
MPRHCYIRTFFGFLDDRSDILELLTAILENRIHLLEKPHHIFEDRPYIETFSVLLELPTRILELSTFVCEEPGLLASVVLAKKSPRPASLQSVREPQTILFQIIQYSKQCMFRID